MRHRLLTGAVLALLAWPATGHAQSGGADVPAPTGGAHYGVNVPALKASRFVVAPRAIKPGAPVSFRYRVDGTRQSVRVRVDLLPLGSRHPSARIRMGWKHTGRTLTRTWTPPLSTLTPGSYVARLHAVDRRGRTLRRSATASGRSRLKVVPPPPPPEPVGAPAPVAPAVGSGVFPVQGRYTWGEGFGADRGTAKHRGQDILAAAGTPVVTPRAGTVSWRAYQAEGAGHYLVIHADDGRDLVFMHFLDGSLTVAKGDAVTAGQVIGHVGQTGRATAPHLHFEIWPDGWYASEGSQPIDPRPDLEAWAAR
jgi:murein DD-endopeptidase MepM/ murein hydrolase activator NlpD